MIGTASTTENAAIQKMIFKLLRYEWWTSVTMNIIGITKETEYLAETGDDSESCNVTTSKY